MKPRFLLLALSLLVQTLRGAEPPATDAAGVRRTIEAYYAAFSSRDAAQYRTLVTEDYILIEQGDLLGLKEDIATFSKPDVAKQQRTDRFDFHSLHVEGTTAVAVYTLKSEIRRNGETQHRVWRESAILRRAGEGWKVYLLHSTKIDPPK